MRHHLQAHQYLRDSHPLRLSASPLGPANPAKINFTQEPLDFRRHCLSQCLSLLMSAFALPMPPEALTGLPSSAYGTLSDRSIFREECRTQSFGSWLEPRYIFGAETLI